MSNPSLYTNRQVISSALMSASYSAVEVSDSMAILGVTASVSRAFHVSITTLASVSLAMGEYPICDTLGRLSSADDDQQERIARLLHAIDNSSKTLRTK